ncbi:putative signal peptide protein [Puccinia sorghi]|uniref:Putative signal peptide protein n=1 Tax=Puccinia sorghi TaxID=27349 RepID=A0A0L6UVR8_9BASI|nr:putative signal peptide protein [Puccinia sorghi]
MTILILVLAINQRSFNPRSYQQVIKEIDVKALAHKCHGNSPGVSWCLVAGFLCLHKLPQMGTLRFHNVIVQKSKRKSETILIDVQKLFKWTKRFRLVIAHGNFFFIERIKPHKSKYDLKTIFLNISSVDLQFMILDICWRHSGMYTTTT